MKLTGDLKKQVENSNSKEEAKAIIEKAGMSLNDDELDDVIGGVSSTRSSFSGSALTLEEGSRFNKLEYKDWAQRQGSKSNNEWRNNK